MITQASSGRYQLTASGRDLEPVVFGLATWGARWTFGEPAPEELDPDLLLWWLHRRLDPSKLPRPTFTIFVNFTDHPKRYWIVVDEEASLCLADPPDAPQAVGRDSAAMTTTHTADTAIIQRFDQRSDITSMRSRAIVHRLNPRARL